LGGKHTSIVRANNHQGSSIFVSGGLSDMDRFGRVMVEIIKLRRIGAAISVSQYPLGNCHFANIIPSARRNFASSLLLLLLFFFKKENIYDESKTNSRLMKR
jgi:hypothetical protein